MLLVFRRDEGGRPGFGALTGAQSEGAASVRERSLTCCLARGRAGFLPFSAIYIELHYIFSSIWGHKVRRAGLGAAWCIQGVSGLCEFSYYPKSRSLGLC